MTYEDAYESLGFHVSDLGIKLWIRHVVVPGITDGEDQLFRLGEFISTLPTLNALDVLAYHDMGKIKYQELGIDYPLEGVPPLGKEQALAARQIIMKGIRSGLRKQR